MLVGAALVIAAVSWWVLQFGFLAPEEQTQASGYGQFVLAAVGFVIMVAGPVAKAFMDDAVLSEGERLDILADEVRLQWDDAAVERGLVGTTPVSIRWCRSRRPVAGPVGAVATLALPVRFGPLPGVSTVDPTDLGEGDQTGLHDVYGGLGSGRLMLIGPPGAGKSAAAVLLLRDALRFRQAAAPEDRRNIPVPVMFPLHGWDPTKVGVVDWLAGELARLYPLLRSPARAARLLWDGRLAVFFDGLDEIDVSARPEVLKALGTAPFRVVLSTRAKEAELAAREAPLYGAAALELRPVAPAAAVAYLRQRCVDPPPPAWQALFAHVVSVPCGVVAQALDTPLVLSLVHDVYSDSDAVDELLDADRFPTSAAIENHLLDQLVTATYTPRPGRPAPRYDVAVARRTMTYLAAVLAEAGTRDLRWWHLDQLPHHARRKLFLGFVFTLALKLGIVTRLGEKPSSLLLPRLRDLFSERRLKVVLAFGLVGSIAGGLVLDAAGGMWPVLGALSGFVLGALATLVTLFDIRREYGSTEFLDPAQAWRHDRNVLLVHAFTGAFIGSVYGAIMAGGLRFDLVTVTIGVLAGFLVGFLVGVSAASATISTAMFTFIRISRTHRTPLRLVAFLEDARRRHILRVTGDAYQFRHAKLQDRLAESYRHA
ncbi:hypothetical protein CLV71_101325 [Actinophytocola oryzae]|uniref:NACHT domain-containing protein n=2 Tax=Actinophytocola oryzae TaxID=502181 RepID=A0A4R7W4E9_9PSEU|nr:hypothetical protein CLV71_101325 [Actinophytocola oryzae]